MCTCKQHLMSREHIMLGIPPYCPELQPITLFKAAGTNHVVLQYETNQKMKTVVTLLYKGCYGIRDMHPIGYLFRKSPVNYQNL